MSDGAEKGLMSFLGMWLLFHEVADEWIKKLIENGKSAPEDQRRFIEDLARKVDSEKEELREILGESLGGMMSRPQESKTSNLSDEIVFKLGEIENRLVMIERDIETIKERH